MWSVRETVAVDQHSYDQRHGQKTKQRGTNNMTTLATATPLIGEIISVYADGGCIGRNPSKLGGTWCCITVVGNICCDISSGVILPGEIGLPTVTNNVSELWAAVEALGRCPAGWNGTLYTDSNVTRLRLGGGKLNGVPDCLKERLHAALKRAGAFRTVLLDGHPTKRQLAAGRGKRGNPVSWWNCRCDAECNRQAAAFLRSH